MRRLRDVWDRITSLATLHEAARLAMLGKRHAPDALRFWLERERECLRLRDELRSRSYQPLRKSGKKETRRQRPLTHVLLLFFFSPGFFASWFPQEDVFRLRHSNTVLQGPVLSLLKSHIEDERERWRKNEEKAEKRWRKIEEKAEERWRETTDRIDATLKVLHRLLEGR